MDSFSPSILEYLGKIEGGILVLVSIMYQNEYYESTFYYTDSKMILTISQELEDIVGDITQHQLYPQLLRDILKRIVPYNEIINSIDEIDFSRWVNPLIEMEIIKNIDNHQ